MVRSNTTILREGRQYEVDARTVKTDEVLNGVIGDSIDYIDPRWIALFDGFIYHQQFMSDDAFQTPTSGSGSASLFRVYYRLDTGTTSGSTVEVRDGNSVNAPTFDNNWALNIDYQIRDGDGDRIDYATVGNVKSNSVDGFGFKVANGDLLGVVHNGTSETTTTLQSNPGVGEYRLTATFTTGSEIVFDVDGTQEGTISSGLPSGGLSELMELYLENTSAVQRRVQLSQFTAVMLP